MSVLNVVFLSGSGGVGKTSVAKEIAMLCEGKIAFSMTQSTTRASYASMGILDEAQALEPGFPRDRWEALQERIFSDYCESLIVSVREAVRNKQILLVVDRSPWDHASYFLQQAPYLSMEAVEARLNKCQDTLEAILNDFSDNLPEIEVVVTLWTLCYPTAWTTDASKDAWRRHAPAAKNYVWSLALTQMVSNEIKFLSTPVTHKVFDEYDELSVADRAAKVLLSVGLYDSVSLSKETSS